MSQSKAESIIVVAAMIVGGLWAYQQYQSGGADFDFTKFATAWGAIFLILALVVMFSPQLAAAFAGLVVVADLLTNGTTVANDILGAESQTVAPSSSKAKNSTGVAPGRRVQSS